MSSWIAKSAIWVFVGAETVSWLDSTGVSARIRYARVPVVPSCPKGLGVGVGVRGRERALRRAERLPVGVLGVLGVLEMFAARRACEALGVLGMAWAFGVAVACSALGPLGMLLATGGVRAFSVL